jgi:hypothetical protein
MERLDAADRDARLRAFLAEDLGSGDVTSDATVPEFARAQGELVAKSECVVLRAGRRAARVRDPRPGRRMGCLDRGRRPRRGGHDHRAAVRPRAPDPHRPSASR